MKKYVLHNMSLLNWGSAEIIHTYMCTYMFIWHLMFNKQEKEAPADDECSAMWVWAPSFPSDGAGKKEIQEEEECADLNTTTWHLYRQQRARLRIQYLLLTRSNIDCAQTFTQESLNDTQPASYFSRSRPTKVIIHGYRSADRLKALRHATGAPQPPIILIERLRNGN